jgi:hypothetical protein
LPVGREFHTHQRPIVPRVAAAAKYKDEEPVCALAAHSVRSANLKIVEKLIVQA